MQMDNTKKIIMNKVIKAVALALIFSTAAGAIGVYYTVMHRRDHVELHARRQSNILRYSVETSLLNLNTLAAMVMSNNGKVDHFYEISKTLVDKSAAKHAIGSLQLAPKGVVTTIYPEQGNEKGKIDLFADPERRTEAEWARDTGNMTMAGPYKLLQGGFAAVVRMPVYLSNAEGKKEFWGFVVEILNMPQTLEPADLKSFSEDGYSYCLWRKDPKTAAKMVIDSNSDSDLVNPVSVEIMMPNVVWHFDVAPTRGWVNKEDIACLIGFLFLCCLLTAGYTYHVELQSLRDARRDYANMVRNVLDNIACGVAVASVKNGELKPLIANQRFMNYLQLSEEQYKAMDMQSFLTEAGWQMPEGLLQDRESFKHYRCSYESVQTERLTGDKHCFVFNIECMLTKSNSPLLYLTTTNVDNQKAAERSAMMDSLTQLLNKGAVEQKISECIAEGGTLFMLDLDNFKGVNDNYGHGAGDQLLISFAEELCHTFSTDALIGRIGGDEFVTYVPRIMSATEVEQLLQGLRKSLHNKGMLGAAVKPEVVNIGASIGVVVAQPGEYASFDEAFSTLDGKMYQAKASGKDTYII